MAKDLSNQQVIDRIDKLDLIQGVFLPLHPQKYRIYDITPHELDQKPCHPLTSLARFKKQGNYLIKSYRRFVLIKTTHRQHQQTHCYLPYLLPPKNLHPLLPLPFLSQQDFQNNLASLNSISTVFSY